LVVNVVVGVVVGGGVVIVGGVGWMDEKNPNSLMCGGPGRHREVYAGMSDKRLMR
jgi:hypothetical protein